MIGNIMYGILCYKIYVIYVKIRNIRKIRIFWYCYEWLLLIIYDGLFFIKNDIDVVSIKIFCKEKIKRDVYLRLCGRDGEFIYLYLLKVMVVMIV